jgi:hypothetical protein
MKQAFDDSDAPGLPGRAIRVQERTSPPGAMESHDNTTKVTKGSKKWSAEIFLGCHVSAASGRS